jgi:rhamnosyl/mannosyltransferase
MRVVQLAKFYPPEHGGMEVAVRELTEGLNEAGVRTDVLCNNRQRHTADEKWPGGYRVVRAGSQGTLLSTPMAPALLAHSRKLIPAADLVHVHMPNPMAALALRVTPFDGPLVVHWHSDVVRQKIALKLYEPLQRWLLKRADVIVATSERYANGSAALKPWRHKVAVVPIGIREHHSHKACCCQGSEIRARHAGKRIVFALGRMADYKGFDILVDAAALLPADVVVIIGGGGTHLRRLQAKVMAAGVAGRVHLPGAIEPDALGDYFAAAEVFCMPSTNRAEAFGIAMVEAMAMGKPIVATDIEGSGVPWVNLHGHTGLNVVPGCAESLAAGLRRVLDNPTLAARMGAAARKRYLAEFTAPTMTRRMIDVYGQLRRAERQAGLA